MAMDLSGLKEVVQTIYDYDGSALHMLEATLERSTDRGSVISSHMGMLTLTQELEGTGYRYRDYMGIKAGNPLKLDVEVDEGDGVVEAFRTDDIEICRENAVDIKTLVENAGKVMEGKFLFCRSILPAFLGKGLLTVVEDASQDAVVTLDLCNFMTCEWKPVDCEEIIPSGSFLAIKNPRLSAKAVNYIRHHAVQVINSAAQVELLSLKTAASLFPEVKWNWYEVPDFPKSLFFWAQFDNLQDEEAIAIALSKLGNGAHTAGRFPAAIRWFKLALEYASSNIDSAANLLANIAAAFLRLRCFHRALDNCNAALERNGKHLMATYRKAKALIGLGKFEEAANFISNMLEEEFKEFGRDKLKLLVNIEETARNLASEASKDFVDVDMTRLLQVEDSVEVVEDMIEFTGPLEYFEDESRGRGLRVTADIRPGQLLICSRAFALVKNKPLPPEIARRGVLNNTSSSVGESEELSVQIAYKIAYQPKESGAEFYKLSAGPELGYLDENSEKNRIVDMKRIKSVVTYNCFGTGVRNRVSGKATNTYLGMWTLPSWLNHYCSDANATWSDHGDIFIVRAIKKIAKGEEIFISYVLPHSPYGYRKGSSTAHSFECACRLCQLDREDEENGVAQKRLILLQRLRNTVGNGRNWKLMSEIVKILESLRKSHPNLNACLATDEVHNVTKVFYETGQFDKCLNLLEKIHNVETEVGLRKNAIVTDLNMLQCCLYLKDKRKIREWVKYLKEDAIAAYGSLAPLKVEEARAGVEILKDLSAAGFDIFESE